MIPRDTFSKWYLYLLLHKTSFTPWNKKGKQSRCDSHHPLTSSLLRTRGAFFKRKIYKSGRQYSRNQQLRVAVLTSSKEILTTIHRPTSSPTDERVRFKMTYKTNLEVSLLCLFYDYMYFWITAQNS